MSDIFAMGLTNLERSTAKLFLAKFGNAMLMFGGIVFFTHVLSQAAVGTYFLFYAILGLLSIPADFGVRGALEKRLSEGQRPGEILGSAIAMKLGTVFTVVVAIVLFSDLINSYLGAPLAGLLIVTLVIWEFAKLYLQTLRGEFRVGETATLMLCRRLIWIGLGSLLVWAGYGIRGIIYAMILAGAVMLLWGYRRAETSVERPSVDGITSLFSYSRYHFISNVGTRLYEWMDLVIIGYFLTNALVGAYQIAWQVSLLVLLVSSSLATAFFPQMSEWSVQQATDRVESLVSRGIVVALFITVPAFVGSLIFSEHVLALVYGPDYTVASAALIVLMFEKIFQAANDIIGNTLRALDKPDLVAVAFGGTVIVNFVLNVSLVVRWGILGVAIGTAVSWIFNTVVQLRYLSHYLSLEVPSSLFLWFGVTALAMGAVLISLKYFIPVTTPVRLLSFVVVGVAVYMGVGWLIPPIRGEVLAPAIAKIR